MQTISAPLITDLDLLKSTTSLYDFAALIGVETQFLTKVLYRKPYKEHYRTFEVNKKNGGVRTISAPSKELSEIQFRTAQLFYECRKIIAETELSVGASSYGFEKKKGIYENASKHLNRRFVLNFDLKDFFPSIHIGRIRGFLIKDRNFGLDNRMAEIIAQIACNKGSLPQGSPLSPILSNMVCEILDRRLRKFCNTHRCSFSRYVDDITISTNLREFPPSVAFLNDVEKKWVLGSELKKLIQRTGFEINHSKTRMQLSSQRQVVTGLTVNSLPMPVREFRYKTRAMCHSLFSKGRYSVGATEFDVKKNAKFLRPLKGRVLYLSNISKKSHGTGAYGQQLQRDLVYFESFAMQGKPLIITEGITDRIYLKHAQKYKKLLPASWENKSGVVYDIFKPTDMRKECLALGDGVQQIKNFIFKYRERKLKYSYYPRTNPIICVVDSDGEPKKVLNALDNKFQTSKITDSIFHVFDELYVIVLNHLGEGKEIENYFSKSLLRRKIDNREFEIFNPKGSSYSKTEFAKYIIPKFGAEKDFKSFEYIFRDIAKCVELNEKRLAG